MAGFAVLWLGFSTGSLCRSEKSMKAATLIVASLCCLVLFDFLLVKHQANECNSLLSALASYKSETGSYPKTSNEFKNKTALKNCNYQELGGSFIFVVSGHIFLAMQFYEYNSKKESWAWD